MTAYCASPSAIRVSAASVAGASVTEDCSVVCSVSPPSQEIIAITRQSISNGNRIFFKVYTSQFKNYIRERIELAKRRKSDITYTVNQKFSALVIMSGKCSLDAASLDSGSRPLGIADTMRIVPIIKILMSKQDNIIRFRRHFFEIFYL